MTQPIQEPSDQRALQGFAYQRDQLLRRPSLSGGCTIEYFRAVMYTNHTVGAGTAQVTIDWDEWEYCEEAIFVPLNAALNPASPGEKVRRVQLDLSNYPGRYTFMWGVTSTTDINGTVEMAIHDGDPIWGRPEYTRHGNQTGAGGAFGQLGFYQMTMSRIFPLYDPFGSGTHTPQISFTLAQNSGASEIFDEGVMEIHYEACVNICPEGSS